MIHLLAQDTPRVTFWTGMPGSAGLFMKIGLALLFGFALVFALMRVPTRMRRPIIAFVTFIGGAFFMASWLWPKAPDSVTKARNVTEGVALWLKDLTSVVSSFSQILTTFLLGLGIYSIISIHGKRILKKQTNWPFSMALFIAMLAMVTFGYGNWLDELARTPDETVLNPGIWNYGRLMLFEGMLQQMEAAMFSLIAFFIISAAYRAFRIRSVESTIMLSTALIIMLSIMGFVVYLWDTAAGDLLDGNLKLTEISKFIVSNMQVPGIQAIGYGIGIATVAMAMRIWLSLDKGGLN